VYTVDGEQPGLVLPSLTVNEYTCVPTPGVALVIAEVLLPSELPLQLYALAPPEPLAVSTEVPPLQIVPLLVGAATGVAFTVTVVVYIVDGEQPLSVVPSLTVTE
jgi:hypothetical protein